MTRYKSSVGEEDKKFGGNLQIGPEGELTMTRLV